MAQHTLFEFPVSDTLFGSQNPQLVNSFVRVVWDDADDTIKPYVIYNPSNPSGTTHLITDANDVWFYYGPRAGETSNYRFCDGGTLNYFKLVAGYFPFAIKYEEPDAAACVFSTVCDAYIQTPILTRRASNGGTDGAVTIRGFSTAMGLEYTISNADAETPPISPAWQPSGTFINLPPGNYTAFVRDAQMCEYESPFTIEEEPAYNVRFTTYYRDALGAETVINILKRDYTGDPEDVTAGDEPLVIKEGGGEMFTVLRGHECVISLQASFFNQYIELFTSDDREFRVDVVKAGNLFWRGWIVPDMYLEPYLAPPYNMQFSATDGLGELKNKPFTEELPEGLMSQWDVLLFILAKIETSLIIQSGVSLYETRMNQAQAAEPLKQAIISLDAYHDKGVVWDCARVLEAILKPYGAIIRQCGAAWQIARIEGLKNSFIRRNYEWYGDYTGWINYNPGRLITRPHVTNPFYWIERSQMLELRPAYKQTTVHLDYGLNENIVRGGDMKADDFDAGNNHKFMDGTADYGVKVLNAKEEQYALHLMAAADAISADYLQTERIWVESDTFIQLRLVFDYMVTGGILDATVPPGGQPLAPQFLFSVRLNDLHLNPPTNSGDPAQWLPTFYQFLQTTTNLNAWQTTEVFSAVIPENGWLTIRVYEVAKNHADFINLLIKSIKATLVKTDPPALAEEEDFIAVNAKKQVFIPDTVNAAHGDVIPLHNAPAMYRNLILINNDRDTSLDWQEWGETDAKPILQHLADSMLGFRESSARMLRGILKGVFDWSQVLQEPNGSRYMPITFEYNDRRRTISGEFMELYGVQVVPAGAILLETGEPMQLENNDYFEMES